MMGLTAFWIWMILGCVLVVAELALPGLVVVFVGLGAITVATLVEFGVVQTVPAQLTAWFGISIVYTLSLRFLVLRFYPTDTQHQDIDEDRLAIGRIVRVTETISADQPGRIAHEDTTWTAVSASGDRIRAGARARIVARDNITWTVEAVYEEEAEDGGEP